MKNIAFLIFVFIFQGCMSLFYYPESHEYSTPKQFELTYKDIYLNSGGNLKIHGWHIFPKETSKGLLFVAHGNGQNMSAHFMSWVWLVKKGYELVIMDYRGYGRSEGEMEVEGAIADVRRFLDYVESVHKGSYFVCGQSLGGILLLNALKQRDNSAISSIIIDSAFVGFQAIAKEKMAQSIIGWPFQWIPLLTVPDKYNAATFIDSLHKPILLLHGSFDRVISLSNSWKLFEAAALPKALWLSKKAQHTQVLQDEKVQKYFLKFLTEPKPLDYAQIKIFD